MARSVERKGKIVLLRHGVVTAEEQAIYDSRMNKSADNASFKSAGL